MLVFVTEINKLSACLFEETMSMFNAESYIEKLSKSCGDFGVGVLNKISQFVNFFGLRMLVKDSMEISLADKCGKTSGSQFEKVMLLVGAESVVKTLSTSSGGVIDAVE